MASKSRNSGLDPNAGLDKSKGEETGSAMQELDSSLVKDLLEERMKVSLADRALDSNMSLSEADARREVPRPRTDNLDERFARRIPSDNAVRTNPSSRLKKRLSKQKNDVLRKQPGIRRAVLREFTNGSQESRELLEAVNRGLADANGRVSAFAPKAQDVIRRLDRSISDYERENVGISTVYSPVIPPAGMSQDDLAQRFKEMAGSGQTMTFNRYVVADHSINRATDNAPPSSGEQAPLVFEYETARGMYLGGSDSVADGSHILARGNTVKVVGVKTVTIKKDDGSLVEQRVVQIKDHFDPDLRTTAK